MRARQCADTNTIIVLGVMLEICASVLQALSTEHTRIQTILNTAWIDRCSGHLTASDGSKQLLWQWEKEKDKKGLHGFWQDSFMMWGNETVKYLVIDNQGDKQIWAEDKKDKKDKKEKKDKKDKKPKKLLGE